MNPTTLAENQIAQTESETSPIDGYLGYYQPTMTPTPPARSWWPVISIDLQRGKKLLERLVNPLYGRDVLDRQLDEMATMAPGVEQAWKITESWPSLTKLLLEDRNNE